MNAFVWLLSDEGRRRRACTCVRDAQGLLEDAVARRRLVDGVFAARFDELKAEGGASAALLASWLPANAGRPRPAKRKGAGDPAPAPDDAAAEGAAAGAAAEPQPPKGEYDSAAVAELASSSLAELSRLERDIMAPTQRYDGSYVDRANALARLRVYVLPKEGLPACADGAIAELREWKVPADVLAMDEKLAAKVTSIEQAPAADAKAQGAWERAARAALLSLLEEQDYWSDYIDWYFAQQTLLGVGMAVVVVGGIALSWGLHGRHAFVSFACAGLAGAAASVASKLPPLSVYGDVASIFVRTLVRLLVGFVASVVGFGLLSTHVISVNLGDTKIDQIVANCVDRGAGTLCTDSSALIMLALGLVFGFSERAMTTFEDKIFGSAK